MHQIKINKEIVFKKENNNVEVFKEVKVYASDPWSMPAWPGKIRKLTLEGNTLTCL